MTNIEIKADVQKNILYTKLEGFLKSEDVKDFMNVIELESKKLKKPFVAITDIRKYRPSGPEVQEIIERAMGVAIQNGMGPAIREMQQSVIAAMQFQRISKSFHGYQAFVVSSMEEAEEEASKFLKNQR